MAHKSALFILVGPSGAGKNTLMQRVQDQLDDLPQLATMTTRAMRPGEQNGREHWFVSHEEFQRQIDANALLEWQQVHLNNLYGTPRRSVEEAMTANRDLIADIEFLGANAVYQVFPNYVVLIFVTPSDLSLLSERIQGRGNVSSAALANRLERARFEMTFAPRCHYLVINDDIESAVEQLRRIILSERASRRNENAAPATHHIFHATLTALIHHRDKLLVQDGLLPTFPITDHHAALDEMLQQQLNQTLGLDVTIEAVQDNRFEFAAPNHVTIAATPPRVRLDFVYKCTTPSHRLISGWDWQPITSMPLPDPVQDLLRA
ncbi:MAG: guanylate kinase [Chloroflexi bacterium]|nr:guanylate kinase [Chloroflexota bacterium]